MTEYRLNLYQRAPETQAEELVKTLEFEADDNPAALAYMDKVYGPRTDACEHAVLVDDNDEIIWEKGSSLAS